MALEIHAREIVLGMLWYEHRHELLLLSIYLWSSKRRSFQWDDSIFIPKTSLPNDVFRGASGVPAVTPDDALGDRTEVDAFSVMERLAVHAQLKEKVQKNP